MRNLLAHLSALVFVMPLIAAAQTLDLRLPTDNDAIYRGDGPAFYQYTDRTFQGVRSTPWQGGKYGFTRTPVETADGIVYRHFHEGVDIKPMRRRADGEPEDRVVAIANGRVVHASNIASHSNYGKYVVLEHRWSGHPYYSLYAHLNSISVTAGSTVSKGDPIGLLGYTGAGIDKRRAHVHFEIGLLLNEKFDQWHARFFPGSPNRHGIFNGLNLAGLDVAELYLTLRKRPQLTIPEFLAMQEPVFKVATPLQPLDLLKRYPWLLAGANPSSGLAWEIWFTGSGLPIRVAPFSRQVSEPTVTWITSTPHQYSHITRGYVTGRSGSPSLSASGRRLIELLTL